MVSRYVMAVGIAGIAGLAVWAAFRRRSVNPFALDDDREAEIIRRFAPALQAAVTPQAQAAPLTGNLR